MEDVVYRTEGDPPIHVITLTGDLDYLAGPALREMVIELFNRSECSAVLINLERVIYLDGPGLGVLVIGLKHAIRVGKSFALSAPQAGPTRTLELTGCNRVFEIHATEAEGLKSLRERMGR